MAWLLRAVGCSLHDTAVFAVLAQVASALLILKGPQKDHGGERATRRIPRGLLIMDSWMPVVVLLVRPAGS